MSDRVYSVASFFCGLGGKTLGFLQAETRLFGSTQRFRSLGGIDVDPEACEDFRALTGSPALCADLATLTPEELRAFLGDEAPDVVAGSPPCQGFSGLLSEKKSREAKYQKLNQLVFQWLELVLATWATPPRLILLENVPRIKTRGAVLLRKVRSLLAAHGYASHGSTHNCGKLGGLAQNRERFLLVARHRERVSSLLYQPKHLPVRGCGEVLGKLPLPGDESAGPLHALPKISWLNWLRLALIPPGGDWRDLPKPAQMPAADARSVHNNKYLVFPWDLPVSTVTGAARPGSGAPSVADVRFNNVFMLHRWVDAAGAVTGGAGPSSGGQAVGDVRVSTAYGGVYGVLSWASTSPAVTGRASTTTSTGSVADVRVRHAYPHSYGSLPWHAPAYTIASKAFVGTGAYSVGDVRITCTPRENSGAYGVRAWTSPSCTVVGVAQIDNGMWAVSDPRVPGNPSLCVWWQPRDMRDAPPFVPVLPTADGTWHRPMTKLELAALQGLPTTMPDGSPLRLAGRSTSRWGQRIGNAVPPPTAKAIAEQMLMTLVQSDVQGFALSSGGAIWARERNGARAEENHCND